MYILGLLIGNAHFCNRLCFVVIYAMVKSTKISVTGPLTTNSEDVFSLSMIHDTSLLFLKMNRGDLNNLYDRPLSIEKYVVNM